MLWPPFGLSSAQRLIYFKSHIVFVYMLAWLAGKLGLHLEMYLEHRVGWMEMGGTCHASQKKSVKGEI